METKKEIRNYIRQNRASLSEEVRHTFSAAITASVLDHPLYQQAKEIYCYVSFGDEAETSDILQHAWDAKKMVAVPKILKNGTMEFFYIDSMAELSEGYYGIFEPAEVKPAHGKEVLVIMPGVAFDRHGGRVGYGKGFYDRYLQQHPNYQRMALAFELQCLEQVPTDTQDIRLEFIVTEKEIYVC